MNLRCPPSSALSFITAWAVVALPLKKSRIIADLSLQILQKKEIKDEGFGNENIFPSNKLVISLVPSNDIPTDSGKSVETAILPKFSPALASSSAFQYLKAGLLILREA